MQIKQKISLEEINEVLSEALIDLTEKKISIRQARAISQTALALSKSITNIDLKNRIEFLEQVLKNRKK